MESAPHEGKGLVTECRGANDEFAGADDLFDVVLVGGQPEEPVLLHDPFQGVSVLGTAAVDEVGAAVELLAAVAVVGFVYPSVQVTVGGAGAPEVLDRRRMPFVGTRADEVVEGKLEGVAKAFEA